jgi:hypothetical protein
MGKHRKGDAADSRWITEGMCRAQCEVLEVGVGLEIPCEALVTGDLV